VASNSRPCDIRREVFATKVQPLLEWARKKTKPRTVDLYQVFCGGLYVLKSGCQWRMLPSDFPKWRTGYEYWQKWSERRGERPSLREAALKTGGWRGPAEPWERRATDVSHR
jgi:transposase